MAKSKANPDGYVHTRDGKEYQRLRDQARMWQAATAQLLAAVGLGPGMSCLDVGSGSWRGDAADGRSRGT
jgi:ubiquinone/menaquinone biosynthesis C-methylase UbiE